MNTSFDKLSIDKQVQFLNVELKKDANSSITKLCKKFGLNKSTIVSRFGNKGYNYSFDDRKYISESKVIQKDTNGKSNNKVIQNDNNGINKMAITKQENINSMDIQEELKKALNEVKELLEMKDQLKEVIQEYNKSKNVIDIPTPPELKIDKTKFSGEVKGRLIKVYSNVNNDWIQFCKKNNEFKMQDLYSIALLEFIQKYKK